MAESSAVLRTIVGTETRCWNSTKNRQIGGWIRNITCEYYTSYMKIYGKISGRPSVEANIGKRLGNFLASFCRNEVDKQEQKLGEEGK